MSKDTSALAEQDTFDSSTFKPELRDIEIEALNPHPKNPRLVMREHVIQGIVAAIYDRGFHPKYALAVRPQDNGYEIISGHHRLEAAKRAGLKSIPCWVEEMDDHRAMMEMALSNNQSEMSPLEWGIHALEVVPPSVVGAGRGNTSGLREYAKALNVSHTHVVQIRSAAQVWKYIENKHKENGKLTFHFSADNFIEKSQHLFSISTAPKLLWTYLAKELLEQEWKVKESEIHAKRCKTLFESCPDWYQIPENLYEDIARDKGFADSLSHALITARSVADDLSEDVTLYRHEDSGETIEQDGRECRIYKAIPYPFDEKQHFIDSIKSSQVPTVHSVRQAEQNLLDLVSKGKDSRDHYEPVLTDEEEAERKLAAHRQELFALRQKYMPSVLRGDVLQQIKGIETASVDLIAIDPPYNIDKANWDSFGSGKEFAEWATPWLRECQRVLKPTGSLYLFGVNRMLSHIQHSLDQMGMVYRNWITWDTIQGAGGGLWVNRQESILYYSKTNSTYENPDEVKLDRHEENIREYKGKEYKFKNPSNVWRFPCVDNKHPERTSHPTQKPVELMERIIKANSPVGGLVLDCFMGSGTTCVAAMQTQRKSIGIELEGEYVRIAQQRFDDTEVGCRL